MGIIRILFLADTHLGFDLAFRPRIERRRRGPEFFANFFRLRKAEPLNLINKSTSQLNLKGFHKFTV